MSSDDIDDDATERLEEAAAQEESLFQAPPLAEQERMVEAMLFASSEVSWAPPIDAPVFNWIPGFFWLLINRQQGTLHDRFSDTRVVLVPRSYRPF